MRLSSVVFPEPLGPIRARNSPLATSKLRSFNTSICSLPRVKNLCTPRTRTIGSAAMVILSIPRSRGIREVVFRAYPKKGTVPLSSKGQSPFSDRHLLFEERHDDAHFGFE